MVNTDHIKQFTAVPDPVKPELIMIFFQIIPVINGISPSLACGAEIVRRNPCNKNGTTVCIQKKIVLACPYIHRIHAHIKRHVSHNSDAGVIGCFFYCHPLTVEDILKEHLVLNLFLHMSRNLCAGLRPAFILSLPLVPAAVSVFFF